MDRRFDVKTNQGNATTPPAGGPAVQARGYKEAPLARFASRLLLALNLVLVGAVCLAVVPMLDMVRNVYSQFRMPLPASSSTIMRGSPAAYWAGLGGLAVAMLLLNAFVKNRRAKLICNAIVLFLLVTAFVWTYFAVLSPFYKPDRVKLSI